MPGGTLPHSTWSIQTPVGTLPRSPPRMTDGLAALRSAAAEAWVAYAGMRSGDVVRKKIMEAGHRSIKGSVSKNIKSKNNTSQALASLRRIEI